MNALESIRRKLPSYADYRDQDARHLVDKQVRAYVGEALARLRERVRLDDGLAEQLDRVLIRCEFSDQRLIRAVDHGTFTDNQIVDRIHDMDGALIEAADRADSVDAAQLPAYLGELASLFEARFGAISTAPLR
ncbi:MAG: hypothetical protein ABR591_06995 [Candidatus Velthaea sp.]